jgi:hypothetical protein
MLRSSCVAQGDRRLSAFDLLNGTLESLIVLGCLLGTRAVIRRYWTAGRIVPSRPSGLVWLTLLSTVAVFYFLAALQAFGVPIRNATIVAVLALGFIFMHAAHMLALVIRRHRRQVASSQPTHQSLSQIEASPSARSTLAPVDPGWSPALRAFGVGRMPIFVPLRRSSRQAAPSDGLTGCRIVFLLVAIALLLPVFVFAFISPWKGRDESWPPLTVIVIGVLAIAVALWARRRPIDATSVERLASSYRSNVFLRIGFAESAALSGLVGFLIVDGLWVYVVGMGFSLIGLWLAAPSGRDIQRRQEEIAALGSPLSLLQALTRSDWARVTRSVV